MSGHMTTTSRGSSVGSSASRPRTASRSTSTCRSGPWQACTPTLASPARASASGGRAVVAQVVLQAPEQRGGRGAGPGVVAVDGVGAARRSCSSRTSRASEASSGWRGGAGRRGRRAGGAGSADDLAPRPAPTARARGAAARGGPRGRPASAASTRSCARREPGGAEDRQPGGQVGAGRARSSARSVSSVSAGAGSPTPVAQPPPQLGLPPQVGGHLAAGPVEVVLRGPGPQHVRAGGRRRRRRAARGGGPRRSVGRARVPDVSSTTPR